jgi:MFS family permease
MMAGRSRPLVAVAALCLVQFMDVLGVTVVVTALPAMLSSLHAAQSASTLIATGYAMFFGGLLMLGARLGDRYGHRRTILASLAVFAVGAAVAATSSSVIALTAGRSLQGAAAAASVPCALRLLTTVTPEGTARRRAIAAWSAAGAAAGASGFVIGGIVTDLTSWRLIFWAYLPLAAVLGLVIAVAVPAGQPDEPAGRADQRAGPSEEAAPSLNLAGSLAFTAAVMAFVVGTTVVARPGDRVPGAVLLVGCAAAAAAFVVIDRRAAAPLLPRQLVAIATLRQGALGGFLNTATTSSVITLLTLYLQNTLHRSPLAAAAALLPFSLAVIAGSGLSAAVQRRIRPQYAVAAGLALIAGADLALIPAARSPWAVAACAAAAGLGIGLSSVAATSLGTDVEPRWRGSASGIINTAAQVGTAVGVAALLLVAAATSGVPAAGGMEPSAAWAVGAATAAVGSAWFALTATRRRPRRAAGAHPGAGHELGAGRPRRLGRGAVVGGRLAAAGQDGAQRRGDLAE